MKIFNQIVFSVVVLCTASPIYAGVITSLSLVEKDGVTTNNYPLTFGHVFKPGDVSSGIAVKYNGSLLTTQFDKKTSWPDGSVKFGVVSVVIPKVTANGTGTISIETAASNSSSGSLDKTAILSTNVESNINLSNLNGSGYSGSLPSSLRDQIDSGELVYWLQGAVCTEVLETQQLNNSLNTAWEARFYPGTSFGVRISNSVENVNILYRGNVGYDVSIQQGESSPSTVYSKLGFTHLHGSRWRKVFWLGAEPPETELRYDVSYLISTGAIPNYDISITVPEATIAAEYASWLSSSRDIEGNGLILKAFGTTGSRREISPLPKWSAMYLLTLDNRMLEVVLGHSEIAGHVPRLHAREGDISKSNYGGIVTIDDRPNYDLINDNSGGIPVAIGPMDMGGWAPDRAHHGSFSYLPYLITGDYWHLQEIIFWGGYILAFDEYRRNGTGTTIDFGSGYDNSRGIIYDQLRGVAWSLRTLSDAVFITPDSYSADKNYFSSKLANNIDWLYQANQAGSHGIHAIRIPRDTEAITTEWRWSIAPWMHDYTITSIKHIVDQKTADTIKASYLLSYLGEFTTGRFTNHPTFNKWDGAGYWWPLAEKGGTSFYKEKDWAAYWANVLERDGLHSTQNLPHTDYARYNYADSYLAVATAALSCLDFDKAAGEAYIFAKQNISASKFENNPQWAIVSAKPQSPTIKIPPIIKSIL